MRLEGGFQGRTNKLVDSCYSFWQGAGLAMAQMVRTHSTSPDPPDCPVDLLDMHLYFQVETICNPNPNLTYYCYLF